MGKKKNEGGKNKKGDGEGNKEEKTTPVTVVLKVDMHCEGCTSKIVKCVRGFGGVETVKSDSAANKLTVIGTVDPAQIREKLQQKAKKKVDLISPQPKKDKENDDDNNNNHGNTKEPKQENKDNKKKPDDKKSENEKKPKEAAVTTAVLKLSLHCQGCIEKIHRTVTKTKGVQEMSIDKQKDLVTVKGTMDIKSLAESLTEKFKRPAEIVPPKKEKENGKDDGGGKKKKGGDGEESEQKVVEGGRMEYTGVPAPEYGYMYGHGYGYGYGPSGGYPVRLHAPQMFSDENPNACAVM